MIFFRPDEDFPSDLEATDHHGILAIGGDYSPERLLRAYQLGLFPMESYRGSPLWWNPDPRFVLLFPDLKLARSMRPLFNRRAFRVSYDEAFEEVIAACSKVKRRDQPGSWITPDLMAGYIAMHHRGLAHSVEVWDANQQLVGGLYGIALGKVFFGESMFALAPNASKYGFLTLATDLYRRGYWLIDCQMPTQHLASLGASSISRQRFIRYMQQNLAFPHETGPWKAPDPDDFSPLQSELFHSSH